MGLRLRAQIMTLFVVLIGLSMAVIAYFNVGVFRLSFLADEEQRLRHLGLQAGERVLDHIVPIYLHPELARKGAKDDFDQSKIPGLRYYELWDTKGGVLYRSGQTGPPLPLKEELVRRMATRPLPTHLFLTQKANFSGPLNLPYSDTLPLFGHTDSGDRITYEHLFPIFESVTEHGNLDTLPPARLEAILHLSFDVQSSSRRLNLVTAGNVLLALTFLLTSLMSIHLWSQHAIQRPLEGLVESMRQFDSEIKDVELASNNELINLSQTLHHLALERLKYQRELEQLNRDLEAQVEEKTREMKEFFSLVTHDLRIPLAAIQGYTDLLKRKPEQLSERHLTYVNRISTANGHALELVRNLLEAMKIEFGTLQPVMETFSLDRLAGEVGDELNVDETLPRVVLEPAPENGGEVLVDADRTRIKRVLTNLLSNAQKHAEGTPDVALRWRLVPRKGVRIQVVDQGPGIPVADRQRLFEKFTRAPDSMGNSSGLGLGLYIVGRILESHSQEIAVLGEVGKGTTFEFHLPAVEGAAPGSAPSSAQG
jgi:signal transduction histidine kinase